jgi:hypothetical protein
VLSTCQYKVVGVGVQHLSRGESEFLTQEEREAIALSNVRGPQGGDIQRRPGKEGEGEFFQELE